MKMGVVQNKVWFLLDEEELLPYEVTLDQFRERKPFKENIILALVKKAYDKYGKVYKFEGTNMQIQTFEKSVLITLTEKENIVYLENEYIEEESIVDGIQEIFRSLPDERIYMEVEDVDKKHRLLEKLRSDEGRNMIKEKFLK
ncbi:MAG: hypothetical protein ACI4DS_01770 [Eubacterium sp.]